MHPPDRAGPAISLPGSNVRRIISWTEPVLVDDISIVKTTTSDKGPTR